MGCDVAKGSQLGAQPAGHLVLAGNGGPCSECAPALNRHLWSAFSVQAWCAPALGLPVLLKSRKWKPNASILLSKGLSPFLTPKKSNQIFHLVGRLSAIVPVIVAVSIFLVIHHTSLTKAEDEVWSCTAHGLIVSIYHLFLCEIERNWVLDPLTQFLNFDNPRIVTGVFSAA